MIAILWHRFRHWLGWYDGTLVVRKQGRIDILAHRCDTCGRISGAVEIVIGGPLGFRVSGEPRPDFDGEDDGGWSTDLFPTVGLLAEAGKAVPRE